MDSQQQPVDSEPQRHSIEPPGLAHSGQLSNGSAKGMAREIRNAAGGIELPSHLAARLIALADVTELIYLDIAVRPLSGNRIDLEIIAVTDSTVIVGEALRLPLNGTARGSTTRFSLHPLNTVRSLELAGDDSAWAAMENVRPSRRSITIYLGNDVVQTLPISERGRDGACAVLRLLAREIGGVDGSRRADRSSW